MSSALSLIEWEKTDFALRTKSSEEKDGEFVFKVSAYTDSMDSRLDTHLSVMEAHLGELHEASRFAEGDKTQSQDAEMTLSSGLSSLDRQIADVTQSLSSSETKCDELESRVTANTDSTGLKLAQDAGRPSAMQAQRGELLDACRSAEDTDESEVLRQDHTIIKSINRFSSSASVPLATNIVQTEKRHEVPFIGTATQDTGWVKRWFKDRSFGCITPKDGGEDVYIHWK